jgi:Ca-activated chloride channel family protein
VLEEPKVADVDALPEPVEEISWAAPGTTARTKVVGGSSFADAAQIEPGSYRGTIVPGEVLTYAVEVGYGQQLSAEVTYPRFDGKLAEALRGGLITQVEAFSPARAPAAASAEGHFPKSWLDFNGTEIGFATAPVAFSNLSASGPTAAASVPGRYVVTLFVEEDPDGSDYLVPFRLDVGVSGDLAEGPTFVEEPIPAATPSPTAPETTTPPSPQGAEDEVEAAAASDEGGLSAGAVVGGLGAVALLAGAYLAISARRRGAG